jgi:repressor LexA
MHNAGIHDGDYVFVRSQKTAQPGDMVVAVIEDDATVKWYRPREGKVYLEPDNPSFDPIIVTRQFELAGKVVGMMRRF